MVVMPPKLPDEVIDEAIQRNFNAGNLRWDDGDFLAGVVDEFSKYFEDESIPLSRRHKVSRKLIIRQLADETGGSFSTMADSESMARKFSKADRRKWDMLTFHQLRACAQAGDKWEMWADWAVRWGERHGGRPAPIRVIRRAIKREVGAGDESWFRWLSKMVDYSDRILEDNSAPSEVIELVREWRENVEKTKV